MNHDVYVINLQLKEKLQTCMTTNCTITSQVVLNTFAMRLKDLGSLQHRGDEALWILDALFMLGFVSIKRISKKYNLEFGYIAKAP